MFTLPVTIRLIPNLLDGREDADVDLPEFLKLVDHHVEVTRGGELHEGAKDVLEPFGDAEHDVAELRVDLPRKRLAQILFALPLDEEVDVRLTLQRLHDERRLADPPPTRHDRELRDLLAPSANLLQVGKLSLPVEKPHGKLLLLTIATTVTATTVAIL